MFHIVNDDDRALFALQTLAVAGVVAATRPIILDAWRLLRRCKCRLLPRTKDHKDPANKPAAATRGPTRNLPSILYPSPHSVGPKAMETGGSMAPGPASNVSLVREVGGQHAYFAPTRQVLHADPPADSDVEKV